MKSIDALALIREQISKLETKEQKLKDKIIATYGEGYYEGDNFAATILVTDRENLDIAAARAKLSPQFIAAHTLTQTVTTVRTSPL